MSKTPRRSYSWKPTLAEDEAAVVVSLKRGGKPGVFQMSGPVDLITKILEAVNGVQPTRVRRRSRSDD